MGCGVVPGNVYALSGCHCGPHASSINNRSSIGMIGCFKKRVFTASVCGQTKLECLHIRSSVLPVKVTTHLKMKIMTPHVANYSPILSVFAYQNFNKPVEVTTQLKRKLFTASVL